VEESGGSHLDLAGISEMATINSGGGGEFGGGEFVAQDVSVDINGGSDVLLTVTNRITGSASGGSNLVYQGGAAAIEVRSSRGADVRRWRAQ